MDIEKKYHQALDVIVGLSNDIQELKSKCIEWSAKYGEQDKEIKRLKGELKQKETLDKNVKVLVKDQAKKVKHLFPLENTPGYGQLCDLVLLFSKALEDIRYTYLYGQPNHEGEVMVEIEDTCDAMYQIALKATENFTK